MSIAVKKTRLEKILMTSLATKMERLERILMTSSATKRMERLKGPSLDGDDDGARTRLVPKCPCCRLISDAAAQCFWNCPRL